MVSNENKNKYIFKTIGDGRRHYRSILKDIIVLPCEEKVTFTNWDGRGRDY